MTRAATKHLGALVSLALVLLFCAPMTAQAYQITNAYRQAEQRNVYGQLTVEASNIWVIACNGAGENGRTYYIYAYLNRSGFRAILPPHWTSAVGGRDWATFDQAARAACGGGSSRPPAPPPSYPNVNLTGTWIGSNGATFQIVQSGSSVSWHGQSADGMSFVHTFNGAISGDRVSGHFQYVGAAYNGDLVFQITSAGHLTLISNSAQFGSGPGYTLTEQLPG